MSYKVNSLYTDSIAPPEQPHIGSQYKQDLQNNIAMATNSAQQQQQSQQQSQQRPQQQPPQQSQQQWMNQSVVENPDLEEKMNCKKTLNEYIFDFLSKSSLKNTAAAFAQDAQLNRDMGHEQADGPSSNQNPANQSPLSKVVDTPEGFLYEWWQIFWDIFNTSSSRGGSEFAQQYYQLVLQEQRQDQIYRSLAVHAARLQHDAERRGEFIDEDVDPMHLAATMLGSTMPPAVPIRNVNVNHIPIPMAGNPIVNNFPIPPYNNANPTTGATTVVAATLPSGDFTTAAPTQNRNQNVTGWPVYNYPMQPYAENLMGNPCNNNTINTTTNNISPVNHSKNLKPLHAADRHNNVAKFTRSRSVTSKVKARATTGLGAKRRRKNNTATVSAGATNAGSPCITTPGSTTSEPAMVSSRHNKTPKSDLTISYRNQATMFNEEDIYSNIKSSPSMDVLSPSTVVAKQPAKYRKNAKKASPSAVGVDSVNKGSSSNGVTGKKRSPPNTRTSRRKSTPSVILNCDASKDENNMLRTFSNNSTPNLHSAPPTKVANPLPFPGINLGSFNKPAVSSPLSSVTESCFDPESGKVVTKGGPKRAVNPKVPALSPLNIATPPSGDAQKQRNSKPPGSVVIKPPQGFSTTNLNITLKSSKIITSQNNTVPHELPAAGKPLEAQIAKDPRSKKDDRNVLSTPEESKTPNGPNQAYELEALKNSGSMLFSNQVYTSTNRTPNGNSNLGNEAPLSKIKDNGDSTFTKPEPDIGTATVPQLTSTSTTEHQNSQPQDLKFGNIGMVEDQGPDYDLNLLDTNENDFNFINWEG
ncbi:flo8p [Saccharomyces arboricola H-6]|uniref:Flo8p n=1 Tax=Saccharomyces arboricola (strain H-6 / AS 2.3317 / CBS 10644) TaxID=1160507 RepID=J8Q2U7_SACAR|nr:flo8p [Saccharomyces arboricola H-6]